MPRSPCVFLNTCVSGCVSAYAGVCFHVAPGAQMSWPPPGAVVKGAPRVCSPRSELIPSTLAAVTKPHRLMAVNSRCFLLMVLESGLPQSWCQHRHFLPASRQPPRSFICSKAVELSGVLVLFLILFIFNWKITAFQYFVGSAYINMNQTYVPSLLNLPPTSDIPPL